LERFAVENGNLIHAGQSLQWVSVDPSCALQYVAHRTVTLTHILTTEGRHEVFSLNLTKLAVVIVQYWQ